MTSGGARNRSGPQPSPTSGRSDARGLKFVTLPAEGFSGKPPTFPLPPRSVLRDVVDEFGARRREVDEAATRKVSLRERKLWRWVWTTPQAWMWAQPAEAWRLMSIAMWVRTYVLCEGDEATAADKGSLHRFADQIGMTPAGLRENGWMIAADELAQHVASKPTEGGSARSRMRVIRGG